MRKTPTNNRILALIVGAFMLSGFVAAGQMGRTLSEDGVATVEQESGNPFLSLPQDTVKKRGTIVDYDADTIRKLRIDSTIRLIRNVGFHHNGAIIQCDSAYRYNDKQMDCFSNVIIHQDSTYIYGDKVTYDGNADLATVHSPLVKITNGKETVMYTYALEFNTYTSIGTFKDGGIVMQRDNFMEAERGVYNSNTNDITLHDNVSMRNNSYLIRTDSLKFNLDTEVTTFLTKTFIWDNDRDFLTAESGNYNHKTKTYTFTKNAYILTPEQELWGDNIIYNTDTKEAIMVGNVQILDTTQKTLAFGDWAYYNDSLKKAILSDLPSVRSWDKNNDTVYMRADSMYFETFPLGTTKPDLFPAPSSGKVEELRPLLDSLGKPILDSLGNPIMELIPKQTSDDLEKPVLDSLGNPVLDSLGNPIFEKIKDMGTMKPALDSLGNPVLDSLGNPVFEKIKDMGTMKPALDSLGNPVLDSLGNPVMERIPKQISDDFEKPILDSFGNQVLDSLGNPMFEKSGELEFNQKSNSRQLIVPLLDSLGKPVLDSLGKQIFDTISARPVQKEFNPESKNGDESPDTAPMPTSEKIKPDEESELNTTIIEETETTAIKSGNTKKRQESKSNSKKNTPKTPKGGSLPSPTYDTVEMPIVDTIIDKISDSLSIPDSLRTGISQKLEKTKADTITFKKLILDSLGNSITDSIGNPIYEEINLPVLETIITPITDSLGNQVIDSLGNPITKKELLKIQLDSTGQPILDSLGKPIYKSYKGEEAILKKEKKKDTVERLVRAFGKVRTFGKDFQSACDSLVGYSVDSTLSMFGSPILWNEDNQITAQQMDFYTKNEKLDWADFIEDPFVIQKVDSTRYTQAKSKSMQVFFKDNEIELVNMKGNLMNYYYWVDEDDDVLSFATIESSELVMRFRDRKPRRLNWIGQSNWKIFPIDSIPSEQPQLMEGFEWITLTRAKSPIDICQRIEKPSMRLEVEAYYKPQFYIETKIMEYKKNIIKEGIWRDRSDKPTYTSEYFTNRKEEDFIP